MSDEKLYVGTKIITAVPMDSVAWNKRLNPNYSAPVEPAEPGYKVTYPDGCVRWSPKDVFDTAYREVTEGEIKMLTQG